MYLLLIFIDWVTGHIQTAILKWLDWTDRTDVCTHSLYCDVQNNKYYWVSLVKTRFYKLIVINFNQYLNNRYFPSLLPQCRHTWMYLEWRLTRLRPSAGPQCDMRVLGLTSTDMICAATSIDGGNCGISASYRRMEYLEVAVHFWSNASTRNVVIWSCSSSNKNRIG